MHVHGSTGVRRPSNGAWLRMTASVGTGNVARRIAIDVRQRYYITDRRSRQAGEADPDNRSRTAIEFGADDPFWARKPRPLWRKMQWPRPIPITV